MPLCHLISDSPVAPAMCTVTPQKSKASSSDNADFPSMSSLDDALAHIVSPSYSSLAASPSSRSMASDSSEDLDDDEEAMVNPIVKTAHKLLEERGFERSEPLLQENPNRFVLFPIQDDDVS